MLNFANELWDAAEPDSGNPASVRQLCAIAADVVDTVHSVATLRLPIWLAARIDDWKMIRQWKAEGRTVNEV